MNKYYFTESKWYGPLPDGLNKPTKENYIGSKTQGWLTRALERYDRKIESLPSGDSLIPQFAGMVKEENKDFKWKYEQLMQYRGKPPEWVEITKVVYSDLQVLPYAEDNTRKTAVPVAEEGFNKDEMQKVQDDIDSVMKGKIVDKAKLIGISAISNDELCDIVQNACQLINGFKPDAVEGNYWSDWDESVLQSLIEILRRTQPAYGIEEGKQTFSEDAHIAKFKELMSIIDRYNKSTGETGCGNHVYNEIREHLAEYLKTKQLK